MKKHYIKFLLLTAVCSAVAMSAADNALQTSVNTTRDSFNVDKQKIEAAAEKFVGKGNELFFKGDYKAAIESYVMAAHKYGDLMANSDYFTEKYNKTQEMIAKSYYYWAQETALKAHEEANHSDLEQAIKLCKEAIKKYPPCAKEMNERIAVYEKMRAAAIRRNRVSESQVIPGMAEEQYKIAILLKQAKMLYKTKQYELARQRFREVLLIDKINADAIQGMRAADIQIKKAGENRYRITHKRSIAEAGWKSVDPIIKHDSYDVRREMGMADIDKKNQNAVVDDGTAKMREKLRNIVIPVVDFGGNKNRTGTPLPEALSFLRIRSKAHDPEGKGVNIFLYYPQDKIKENAGEASGNSAPANSGDDSEDADNGEESEDGEEGDYEDEGSGNENIAEKIVYPQVNMNLVNKSLLDIIETLAQATNMKYKVEKHAVVLAPKDVPMDDMQIKVFMFDESMVEALGGNSDPEVLKENLMLMKDVNVEFPTGAKVMYDPKFRSLIVLNTPENLAKINEALTEIRKQEPQPMVQVQVKFVEIEQSDLKELGFIQSLGRPDGDFGQTNGRLQFDKNDNVLYDSGRQTFTFTRSENAYNYNLTINAINQMSSKDVLSSPKVLTNPGKKVIIKMTSERYFEWDYEEGEFETSNSDGVTTYSYTPPWPEFEKLELGISMEITPRIDKEKRLIMLDVHPWVNTLVGWSEYQYVVSSDDGGGIGTTETMRRPIVAERTTDTNVVIANGETVVIGGIIKDYTVTVDDKVPLLGDIPLLGNFFKSKSKTIKKTNLLIFVTAQMLKPDGTPYFPVADTRGKPSSGGIGDIY